MTFTPPDIVIALILAFFAFNGLRHGFIHEIARIISLVGGFICASKFNGEVQPFLAPYISNETLIVTASYLIVFTIVVIVISLIAQVVQKFFELIILGWLNRLLGFLLGVIKGFLIVSLMIFIIQAIPLEIGDDDSIRTRLENESVMYQICNNVKETVISGLSLSNQVNSLQQTLNTIGDENNVREILGQDKP